MQAPPEPAPNTLAQDPASRSTEFVAVEGGGETTSAEALLVGAYLGMWALLLGFVYMSFRRLKGLETRCADLERGLARGAPSPKAEPLPATAESAPGAS